MASIDRHTSFGVHGLRPLEKIGVWLSHRAIDRVIRQYSAPRLLDIGSGYGCRLIRYFGGRLGASTAVDIQLDPSLRDSAGITLIERAIEDAWPEIPEQQYDVVTAVNVLEHVWHPLSFLTESAKRLRSGGTLVVNVPTWLGKVAHETQAFRLGLSSAIEIDDHKHYFNKRDLWPLLVRAGFKPSRIKLRYHKLRLNLFATARAI
jgi:2-polyprenyl-3-methyl-5-hydroxy-6-metoxy-1,4-benzoquinol methylase